MTVENLEIKVKTDADQAAAKLTSLSTALSGVQSSAKSVSGSTGGTAKGITKVGEAAKKANKPLGNFISSLKRIAFYRIIRGIIKSITSAFTEGLQNAYAFSNGIEGEGHRFAAAMDSIKTAGATMKNQLGAAFIGLLTAIAPVINQIVALVTKLADALSQIFSVFTGTTYLKAAEVPQKWADAAGSAGKAAKEWKNQLLGFDEINRLNEPSSGGGGGGSSAIDPSTMFQDSPIEDWVFRLKEKIQPIIEDIKLMFQGLMDFINGVFTGDWELAFKGLGEIVEGFGRLINDVLNVFAIPAFDGFAHQVILIIDKLFQYIEEKTGLDLTKIRETVAYGLNYLRFLIEGFAIQAGWVIQDLCEAASKAIQGDWQGAWDAASKMVSDASVNIIPVVQNMATDVANNMVNGGNASADFAEAFSNNMEVARGQMAAMGDSSLEVQETQNGLSFFARIGQYWGNIMRLTSFFGNSGWLFANGGFPSEGQLFVANEAGPELVGTMGGHTAVANQGQIVEGIRQGVYDAVVAANANGNNDVNVKVYLDSREIKVGQQRLNRAWG